MIDLDSIELGGQLPYGCHPPMPYVLADRSHHFEGDLHVEVGTGQHIAQVVRKRTAQIDTGNHRASLRSPASESASVHHVGCPGLSPHLRRSPPPSPASAKYPSPSLT